MQKFTDLHSIQDVARKRYLVDAKGKVLGRLAQEVAKVLRGKHKPTFSYHVDLGDHVVIFNAEKVRVTGKKLKTKTYTRYSGYPGGLRRIPLERMLREHPERVVQHAVQGMLPKTPLGRKIFKKLRVYRGETLPFGTKNMEALNIPS
ncbi:MAG: 50S ribosomal protein L13 [Candidatus Omnitrophota bacterium]